MRSALIVLVACGAPARVAPEPPAVTVLEPGAQPQRIVQYDLPATATARATLTIKATLEAATTDTTLHTTTQRSELPTERSSVRYQVVDRTPAGHARLRRTIDEVSLDADGGIEPAARTELAQRLAPRRGRSITWWVAPSGEVVEPPVDGPAEVEALQLVRIVAELDAVQFPSTPIGAGARWRIVSRPTIEGVRWTRTESLVLRALDDATATLEREVVLEAAAQDLKVEPDETTRLTGARLTSTGKLVVPLRGLGGTRYVESAGVIDVSVRQDRLEVSSSTRLTSVITEGP